LIWATLRLQPPVAATWFICSQISSGACTGGDEAAPPRFISLDSEMMGLNVCADTFAEFLYRFWIENEIFFALGSNQPLTPAAAAYAAGLPRTATRP